MAVSFPHGVLYGTSLFVLPQYIPIVAKSVHDLEPISNII